MAWHASMFRFSAAYHVIGVAAATGGFTSDLSSIHPALNAPGCALLVMTGIAHQAFAEEALEKPLISAAFGLQQCVIAWAWWHSPALSKGMLQAICTVDEVDDLLPDVLKKVYGLYALLFAGSFLWTAATGFRQRSSRKAIKP
eukprot:m.212700 g.212700  ORF g.212700 m.212700 type:complete len:143 (-) comp21178_c0_seq1:840-1268(-)